MSEALDINGNRAMPGPVEWFQWLESSDSRFRYAAIVELAAADAKRTHEDSSVAPLTAHGVATCAASTAIVLADPDHWNRRHIIAGLRRALLPA